MNSIKQIIKDGEVWYKASDLGRVLGMRNIKSGLNILLDRERCLIHCDVLYGKGFTQEQTFINDAGLKRFLISCRKPKALDLCKELGFDIFTRKYSCKEADTIGAIMKAFSGEKMKPEFVVGKYRIDLYFYDYNLSVECDENNHRDRDPLDEKKRDKYITRKLKCQWLRFNPDDKDFNIYQVINQIFIIMKTKMIDFDNFTI